MNLNRTLGVLGSTEREKAGLMSDDVVDDVDKRSLKATNQVVPELFDLGISIRRSVRVSGLSSSMQRAWLI